jgi:hypothetical protein
MWLTSLQYLLPCLCSFAQNRACLRFLPFAQNLAEVEARKFHEASRADRPLNNLIQSGGPMTAVSASRAARRL